MIYVVFGSMSLRVEAQPLACGTVKREVIKAGVAALTRLFPDFDGEDRPRERDVVLYRADPATGTLEQVT